MEMGLTDPPRWSIWVPNRFTLPVERAMITLRSGPYCCANVSSVRRHIFVASAFSPVLSPYISFSRLWKPLFASFTMSLHSPTCRRALILPAINFRPLKTNSTASQRDLWVVHLRVAHYFAGYVKDQICPNRNFKPKIAAVKHQDVRFKAKLV